MPIDVLLPQWGMGMQEGTVVEWLKAEGDVVEEGEPLVEVETEKAVDFVDAPASGTLVSIHAHKGETIAVFEVLAVIVAPGETLG